MEAPGMQLASSRLSDVQPEAKLATHLSDAPPQVAVAGGHNIALVLPDTLTNAVISVGALVGAWQPINPRILHDAGAGLSSGRPCRVLQQSDGSI